MEISGERERKRGIKEGRRKTTCQFFVALA